MLTRSRIDPHARSGEIDRAVRSVIADALSLYALDEERLARARPDVIITQDLCEVCAVSLDDVRAAVARLIHREDVRVVSLQPTRLGDVWDDVVRVADAIGRPAQGRRVRQELHERIAALATRASAVGRRPRVVSIEWLDPVMLGGTWMPELIAIAGGTAVGAQAGAPAPTVTLDQLASLAPDVIVAKPCGFSLPRTLEERPLLDRLAAAVPTARVVVTDGNAFFNRPGPRLVESGEILAACIHPEAFADLARTHAGVLHTLG